MNAVFAIAMVMAETGDPERFGDWGGGWWWIFRPLIALVWIALIGLTLRWVFFRSRWRHEPSGIERARGVLAERYARGEIDAAEYQERLRHLP